MRLLGGVMDKEEFRKEVEKQLKGKSREQQVAFAVRSAMRVLPLLAVQTRANSSFKERREAFGYWRGEEKNTHLLSLLRAYSVSLWGVSVISIVGSSNAAYAAYAAYAADAAYAARADAADAADAAAYAARAYDAAYYAAYAIMAKEIKRDLDLIGQLTAMQFLQAPLWSSPPPEEWQHRLSNFKTDVLSLNAGFEVWLDWYEERLQGQPIDVGLLEQWANIPKEILISKMLQPNPVLRERTAYTKGHII
jgi:hypothetical protein